MEKFLQDDSDAWYSDDDLIYEDADKKEFDNQ